MASTDAASSSSTLRMGTTLPTGYGFSLLDSVLHHRVQRGSVRATHTRVMYCGKLASAEPVGKGVGGAKGGAGGAASALAASQAAALQELSDLHGAALRPDTLSGCLFVLPQSFWAVVEGPPEDVGALLKHIAEVTSRPGSRVAGGVVRVVAHVEDVPEHAFEGFYFRPHNPSADTMGAAALATEMEESHPVATAVPTFRAIVEMGHALKQKSVEGDSRALLTPAAVAEFAASLPSDERIQALSGASKVRCCYFDPHFFPHERKQSGPPPPPSSPPLLTTTTSYTKNVRAAAPATGLGGALCSALRVLFPGAIAVATLFKKKIDVQLVYVGIDLRGGKINQYCRHCSLLCPPHRAHGEAAF
jgi:hypothetical protein